MLNLGFYLPTKLSSSTPWFLIVMGLLAGSFNARSDNAVDDATERKIKVFLLAGQSNMDGRADGGLLTSEDRERLARVRKRVKIAYNRHPVIPLDVTPSPPHLVDEFAIASHFGPELFFGLRMAEAWPNHEILLIKRSRGGTSLHGRWHPEWSEDKATLMGEERKEPLYPDFIGYVRELLNSYHPSQYELCAMLWVQGEQDSGVSRYGMFAAEAYGENLEKLIMAVRRDTGEADLPFIMLQVGSGKVVEGMKRAASSIGNVFLIPQSTEATSPDYLPVNDPPLGHYNYEGMKRIGNKFADVYLREFGAIP